MTTGRGCSIEESDGGEPGNRSPTDTEPDGRPTRRRVLATAAAVSVGATAGCLDSALNLDDTRVEVSPEDPGDDPEATPGEFYFLLEKNGIVVDELYHDTEDNDLILFYESTAENRAESDEEVALIYRVFSEGLVDRGSDVNHLYTEVLDRFDGQVEGWGVNSQWAERHLNDEVGDLQLWNQIVTTMVYEDGERGASENGGDNDSEAVLGDGNESAPTTDTEDGEERDDGDENE
ncbi:hypothetical protein SAMN05444422_1025 [Halobiforma haloterrestris]|uniref:DUF8159 domain-containing protein n=1 Tax=Natronobacterium haloterrestre TaxID=148448 RepID=A0A1I1DV91_NATHA|nr:hypothetical protein [Halobiforma haloterrestris]SFB78747.1 hypothetical protein SAMN05444422_1025 [Halobiforma haloterrestris]